MQFSLRMLLIVMLIGGPALAVVWWTRAITFPAVVLLLLFAGAMGLTLFGSIAIAAGMVAAERFFARLLQSPLAIWLAGVIERLGGSKRTASAPVDEPPPQKRWPGE